MFNVMYITAIKDQQEGEPYPAEQKKVILDALAEYVPKLEQAGLLDMAYIYGFDEIDKNHFAAAMDILGEIKRRYPKLPIMTTARDKSFGIDNGLDAVVDIWVPATSVYDGRSSSIQKARARGRQVWWYICCGPRHPYANWWIEYPATDHRLIMGFMAHKFQTDGFLYYALNLWQTYHNDPDNPAGNATTPTTPYTETMNSGPLTTWSGQSWTTFNGDGQIMYPGPDGPLSTIRMKNIRDGIEDYEYLQLLKDAVATVQQDRQTMESSWLTRAKAALEINPALVTSLSSFTTDGNLLLSERKKIGCLLDEYFTSQNS